MNPNLPSALFAAKAQQLDFVSDAQQQHVVALYDALWQQIQEQNAKSSWQNWRQKFSKNRPNAPRGLYIWGGVGRGKTVLMDVFYQSLAEVPKMRLHFHEFMQRIHQELNQLAEQKDTLNVVAQKWAQQCQVLCLDEFHVNDIGDAMILGTLLKALFANGVILVTTSNRVPADLYLDGLQRERFVPAIHLLTEFCQVVELDNQTDYRQFGVLGKKCFFQPHNPQIEAELQLIFGKFAQNSANIQQKITINGRDFVAQAAENVVWFQAANLLTVPSAQSDYLALAQKYRTVILAAVNIMTDNENDSARRFLNLLDVLYDQKIRLIFSAYAPIEQLYQGKTLKFEFDRATSRLVEMQSSEYLDNIPE